MHFYQEQADGCWQSIQLSINWFPIPLFSVTVFCFFSVLFRVHRVTLSNLFSVSGTDLYFSCSFFCNSFFPVGIPKLIADKLIFSLEGSYTTYHKKHLILCLRHGCWAATWQAFYNVMWKHKQHQESLIKFIKAIKMLLKWFK